MSLTKLLKQQGDQDVKEPLCKKPKIVDLRLDALLISIIQLSINYYQKLLYINMPCWRLIYKFLYILRNSFDRNDSPAIQNSICHRGHRLAQGRGGLVDPYGFRW